MDRCIPSAKSGSIAFYSGSMSSHPTRRACAKQRGVIQALCARQTVSEETVPLCVSNVSAVDSEHFLHASQSEAIVHVVVDKLPSPKPEEARLAVVGQDVATMQRCKLTKPNEALAADVASGDVVTISKAEETVPFAPDDNVPSTDLEEARDMDVGMDPGPDDAVTSTKIEAVPASAVPEVPHLAAEKGYGCHPW